MSRRHLFVAALAFPLAACAFIAKGPTPWMTGNTQFRHKEWAAADATFAKVPPGDEYYQPALQMRARAHFELGQVDLALALMKQAEAVDPARFKKWKNLFYQGIYGAYLTRLTIARSDHFQAFAGGDRVVVVQTNRGGLEAFDAAGTSLWSADLARDRAELGGDPVLAGGVVLAIKGRISDVELLALDAQSGRERWRLPLGHAEQPPNPASDGERAFVVREAGQKRGYELQAVDLASGRPGWSLPLDGQAGLITVAAGRVLLRTRPGTVYAVDAARGGLLWQVNLPGKFLPLARITAGEHLAYHVGEDGAVVALDVETPRFDTPLARIRWRSPPRPGGTLAWAALAGDTLVLPHRREVVGLDAATGALRWKLDLGFDTVPSSMVPVSSTVDGDTVVIAWNDRIAAVAADGGLRWVYFGALPSRPHVAEGMVWAAGKAGIVALSERPKETF